MKSSGVFAMQGEVMETAQVAVLTAGPGIKDSDPSVRGTCISVIKEAAEFLAATAPSPFQKLDFPPAGRPLTEAEQKQLASFAENEKNRHAESLLLDEAINKQGRLLVTALKDPNSEVRLLASQTLEAIALSRLRRLHRQASLHPEAKKHIGNKQADDIFLPMLRAALPVVAKNASHQDERIRVASLYVVEGLEAEAAPEVEAVANSTKDTSSFVRWGAARALAKMAPKGATQAVPALAGILSDDNKEVRATAALALGRFGPGAKPAVPSLSKVVEQAADETTRLRAIQALVAVGTEAQPAVPSLITALRSAPEATVRATAARALGKFVPSNDSRRALVHALKDQMREVRQAASEALLAR